MKKLLTLLGTTGLVAASTLAVVSCDLKKQEIWNITDNSKVDTTATGISNQNIIKGMRQKKERLNENDFILSNDFSQKKSKANNLILKTSTLGTKNLIENNLIKNAGEIRFKPYADIGIVEDTVEYAQKWHSKSANSREDIERIFQNSKVQNVKFNTLDEIVNNKELINLDNGDGINLGFMQNASDTGELIPMWDAAPSKSENNSAEWFQNRWDKWMQKSNRSISKNMTISFGPFANSFWHTAYQNGYTSKQLAEQLRNISKKYGEVKSFDFYFAAPYLTGKDSYKESQKLLASALKILIEEDEKNGSTPWDIRLSLVASNNDGLGFAPGLFENGGEQHVGDEMSPLYVFTKYLGMNFKLNLVTGYLVNDDNTEDGDWEIEMMKKQIMSTRDNWFRLNEVLNNNKTNQGQEKISDVDKISTAKRMIVTPWAGRRAEKAIYNFTPKDMAELRKFAIEQNLGELSMFYITRDHPSEFKQNNNLDPKNPNMWADQNPIDQNIRSASMYEEYAYSKSLNGTYKYEDANKLIEHKKEDLVKDKLGYIDIEFIDDNKEIAALENDGWDGPGNPGDGNNNDGNGGDPIPPVDQGPPKDSPSLYRDRFLANEVRTNTNNWITKKSNEDNVYYSPYLDAGLWEGNDIATIKSVSNLDHLTLAFAQQVNNSSDEKIDISFAGIEKNNEGYDYWVENQLKAKVLNPLISGDVNKLKNVKVAYGGATTGGMTQKNPWNVAYKNAGNNVDAAVPTLKKSIVNFQNEISGIYNIQNIMKSIDFDIEGNAQNDHEQLRVLAKTLAQLKSEDGAWDFSVTLPVLPGGLTNVGYAVLDIFVQEYKNAGLNYKQLPITNLMLMDYGDPIYNDAVKNNITNFKLAQDAIENTYKNIRLSISENYGITIKNKHDIYSLIGATPMIGVNDTVAGVFTEEDAKELYNWANLVRLGYIGIWSMNDDRGVKSDKAVNKSLTTHGLTYLREYDFTRIFTGKWDDLIIKPSDKWVVN